jgi:putative transcriptional regulator
MTTESESTRASLLLAVPQMLDPNFMHTVVLMCQHAAEGAFGFVVNERSPYLLSKLVPDHPLLGGIDFPVFTGGPVGQGAMQFVHRVPEAIPGGHEIADGLHLGGDIEALARLLRSDPRARQDVRMFVGHSGWSAGQLDGELSIGSWVRSPLDVEMVFSEGPAEDLWRRAMRKLGREGEGLSRLPPDVSWN